MDCIFNRLADTGVSALAMDNLPNGYARNSKATGDFCAGGFMIDH
jgi:hypothetical protein